MNMNLDHSKEPDWSNSKTGELELWKNPYFHMNDRLEMADGAVHWRNELIKKLREKLKLEESKVDGKTPTQVLAEKMKDLGITNFKVFAGTNQNVTEDQVAAEMSKALDRLAVGDFEFVDEFMGDDRDLCRSIDALLKLDGINALVPHGLGGHARKLLVAAMTRLVAFNHSSVLERMSETQEPKYGVRDGLLYNRLSGKVIPEDEPVFIFRAQDKYAAPALAHYATLLTTKEHHIAVTERLRDFELFKKNHPERIKFPDTEPKA